MLYVLYYICHISCILLLLHSGITLVYRLHLCMYLVLSIYIDESKDSMESSFGVASRLQGFLP